MLVYTMLIYKWPRVTSQVENVIEEFCLYWGWPKKTLTTISWKRICKPVTEGDLGIWFLEVFNKASMFKLAWEVMKGEKHCPLFLCARFLNGGVPLNYYKSSFIWVGIKQVINQLKLYVAWLADSNTYYNLWRDNWSLTGVIIDGASIPQYLQNTSNHRLGLYI